MCPHSSLIAQMYVHGKTEEVLGNILSRDDFASKYAKRMCALVSALVRGHCLLHLRHRGGHPIELSR
jgi:hypothetical protein